MRTLTSPVPPSEDSSGNSHFKFHKKLTLFTEPKKFKIEPENSVKIPGLTTPTGVVLQQAFQERNRKVLLKIVTPSPFRLASGKLSYWKANLPRNYYVIPS